jgi:2-polyprenyl-3-methyl-5-hydroxy-6-metoxy-1,4-benzoquinol methylase
MGWETREVWRQESLEQPGCDPRWRDRTYAQFVWVNALLSRWRTLYCRYLRPQWRTGDSRSLLDLGCGAADVPLAIQRWAAADGVTVHLTLADTEPAVMEWLRQRGVAELPGVTLAVADSGTLRASGQPFDAVICNHLLHHLRDAEVTLLLADMAAMARQVAIANDLARSRLAWLLFAASYGLICHRSYLVPDGLTSLRRSFTAAELRPLLPPGWTLENLPLFRLVACWQAAEIGRT